MWGWLATSDSLLRMVVHSFSSCKCTCNTLYETTGTQDTADAFQLQCQIWGGTWKHRLCIWKRYFAVIGLSENLLGCYRTGRTLPAAPKSPPVGVTTTKISVTSLDYRNNNTLDAMDKPFLMNYVALYWNYLHIWYGFRFTFCYFLLCGMWDMQDSWRLNTLSVPFIKMQIAFNTQVLHYTNSHDIVSSLQIAR